MHSQAHIRIECTSQTFQTDKMKPHMPSLEIQELKGKKEAKRQVTCCLEHISSDYSVSHGPQLLLLF